MQIKLEIKKLEISAYQIPLTHGKFAIVSPRDYGRLMIHRWKAVKSDHCLYALRTYVKNGHEHTIRMHREITNCPPELEVHHRDHNSLNNRRENLIVCNHAQHQFFHNNGI